MNGNTVPLAECPARLGWTLADETTYADPPWLTVRLVPSFPECHPAINEAGIVFDLLDLFHSARRPGGYLLLNAPVDIRRTQASKKWCWSAIPMPTP